MTASGLVALLRPHTFLRLLRLAAVGLLVEVAVRTVPLPVVSRWLGISLATSSPQQRGGPWPELDEREIADVRLAQRLMRRWPFTDGPCLREALVIGHLLRRRAPVLQLGVTRQGPAVAAHAWIEVAGRTVGARSGFVTLRSPLEST